MNSKQKSVQPEDIDLDELPPLAATKELVIHQGNIWTYIFILCAIGLLATLAVFFASSPDLPFWEVLKPVVAMAFTGVVWGFLAGVLWGDLIKKAREREAMLRG